MKRSQGGKHRVWLHIGMPKTGTTSLQKFLSMNRTVLGRHGYFYPDFGDFQHVALVRKLAREAGSTVHFPRKGDCGSHARFLDLHAEQSDRAHTSIVSSEHFFQRPVCLPGVQPAPGFDGTDILGKTIRLTADYFEGCDVTVLAWLRRQDGWLMSMYNQTVKSSSYHETFDVYTGNNFGVNLLTIVRLWVEAFGRDRVLCHSYDAMSRSKVSIVDAFLEAVLPEIPRSAFREAPDDRNPSLSAEGLWLKRRINALAAQSDAHIDESVRTRIRKIVAQVTRTSPEPGRALLTKDERRALMERFLPDNQALVTQLGYSELQPLIDLGDLSGSGEKLPERAPMSECQHALDQMIKTLVFEA